jgi:O-antigen ligase
MQQTASAAPAVLRNGLGFALFVLLTGTIFTRPSEIIPGLQNAPIYAVLILACIAMFLPRMLKQLTLRSLRNNPITLCVVGLLAAVALSRVSHFAVADAADNAWIFAKVLLYYLLLVSVLEAPAKVRSFLLWLVAWMMVLAVLPLLQYHGIINLSFLIPLKERNLDEITGQEFAVTRLIGIGIYGDPNDLAHILAAGVPICLYALGQRSFGKLRYGWLVPLGLFVYAIALTKSRGGFIALVTGVVTFSLLRYGWRRTLLLGILAMPALPMLLSDRQIDISTHEETGQQRIQVWSDALLALRSNPVFGLGAWQFGGEDDLVAHNSYLQAYAELGLFGGTLFFGMYYLALREMGRLALQSAPPVHPQLVPLLPCLTASLAAYAAGMLTLTRNFIPPTYLFPGLAAVCLGFVLPSAQASLQRVNPRLLGRLLLLSVMFVIGLHVFVRLSVRW